MSYAEFLKRRAGESAARGFDWEPPNHLYDFQAHLSGWAVKMGCAAIFADCGMGKTPIQLSWADAVVKKTNRPVLVLTPLAVSAQTIKEAGKFDIDADRCGPSSDYRPRIWVTNYERLSALDPSKFSGIVCDESSILKNFDGVRRNEITHAMRQVPYRLLCTATAAPNDYTELGTSSEAIGGLGHMDMLAKFFINDQHSSHPNRLMSGAHWRLKGHAERPFWRWVASWARACRKPSDLGFSDERMILPPLVEREYVVESATMFDGELFARCAVTMQEERAERRASLERRCEKAAELVHHDLPAVVWCHLNDESSSLAKMIDGAIEVHGGMSDEQKEEAFQAFQSGQARVMITKPKIGAWGLNWQHCSHVVTFGGHSYEQYYQSIRRCWRFGQKNPVHVDMVISEGEARALENLRRKSAAADNMFARMVEHMNEAAAVINNVNYQSEEVPSWLASTN